MNYGGVPVIAPSVREVPLESNDHVLAFAEDLVQQRFGMVIFMTGVGVRMMLKLVEPAYGRRFVDALSRTRVVARGPKPVSALREVGLSPWATVPGPNTWRELLSTLDGRSGEVPLAGLHVAVQEYGLPHEALLRELAARGADLTSVPIYRWAMPHDETPLRRAVSALARNEIDVVLLTASVQLVHLMRIASQMKLETDVRSGLARTIIASIGPTTSAELREHGFGVDLEASHPKMGFLVQEAAERCHALGQIEQAIQSVEQG
jgi:uroporphyrinogen-III synthase